MRVRWWIVAARAALAAGAVFLAPAASAQRSPVAVARQGAMRVTVEPGGLVTLAFLVSNRSASERPAQGRLALPPDWRLVIPEPAEPLPSHGSGLRLLRIALPSHAASGQYTIRYAIDQTDAVDSAVVVVPGRHVVTLQVREAPRFITAGQPFDVVFEVHNGGNTPTVVHLAASATDGLPVALDSGVVRLEAGHEQLVHARVQSDAAISHASSDHVRLSAAVEGDATRIEPAVSVVEIVPRHAGHASRFRRLPTMFTLRQVDRARRPTVELRGGGPLTAGGTDAQFVLRGLDQTTSLFGEQDEYSLSLASPRYRLLLGDRAAPYSRLGESWRSGFGADGTLLVHGVSVGGFARRDRHGASAVRDAERGGSIGLRPFSSLLAQAGYVSRTGAAAADIWTAHGQLTSWRAASVEADFGRGRDSTDAGRAYAVALTGSFPRGSYSLRRLAADSGFPGLTRGTSSSEASATLIPLSRLSMSIGATDWTAPRRRGPPNRFSTAQRAVDGRIAWGQWLEAGVRRGTDLWPDGTNTRRRSSLTARLLAGIAFANGSIRGGIEQGESTVDDAPSLRIPFRRVTVRGSVGSGMNVLGGSVEWLTGTPVTSWMPDDHVQVTLNAAIRVGPSTRLSTALSATRYGGDRPRTPIVLDVGVTQDLPLGQRASWRTRAASYGPGVPVSPPTHQADYVVPFGLPVGMSDASGTLRTRVLDRESGRPLAGVLLRIGDRVRFTDANGDALFDGLTEAKQYLQVDHSTLGAGRVVTPRAVVAIALQPGETRDLELGVTRGAGVAGRVQRFDAVTSDSLGAPQTMVDGGTVEGAVVQLSNGTDSLRALVDGWGHFSFGQVAPGQWVLSVVRAELPRYHRFEQDRLVLDLQPGSAREILLRVTPSVPPIQMIARADLTLESSIPGRAPAATVRPAPAAVGGQWSSRTHRTVAPLAEDSVATEPRTGGLRTDDLRIPPWEDGVRRDVPPPHGVRRVVPPPHGVRRVVPPPYGVRRDVPPPADTSDAPSGAAPAPSATKHHYTVTRWDVSLVHVARVMYGDASLWPKVWLANLDQVPDPDVIRAGQRLRIPDKAPLTAEEQAAGDRYRARRR